jgi:topoisomerase-4 subunit A
VWYDEPYSLNVDGRGELLGEFRPSDKILIIQQSGKLKVVIPSCYSFWDRYGCWKSGFLKKPISAIYFDGEKSAII